MKLEKYISDLLYRYDLVIVPNFGAIIGRRKNARLDKDTSLFSPPYKELSFNVNLQEDDGLLVRYIADLQQLSNNDALLKIQEAVAQWKRILHTTGNLKLNQIGVFKQLGDSRIIFMPLSTKNYLSEAYGLTTFMHKPIVSEQIVKNKTAKETKKVAKQELVYKTKKPLASTKSNYSRFNKQIVKYAAIFVVGLGLLGGTAKIYQNNAQQPIEKFQKATFILPQDFPTITIKNPLRVITASKAIKKETNESYFIISGAFRNKKNAQKKVDLLKKANYNARIIGKNKSKLHLVAYQGYFSLSDAEKALTKIKETQPLAWIFTTKK